MLMKFNKLIPELLVTDFDKSIEFYTKTLGFEVKYSRKDPKFAMLELNGSQIMIEEINNPSKEWVTGELKKPLGIGINLQIEVVDIDKAEEKILKTGHLLRMKKRIITYKTGEKNAKCAELLIQDPDGYLLRLQETLSE